MIRNHIVQLSYKSGHSKETQNAYRVHPSVVSPIPAKVHAEPVAPPADGHAAAARRVPPPRGGAHAAAVAPPADVEERAAGGGCGGDGLRAVAAAVVAGAVSAARH